MLRKIQSLLTPKGTASNSTFESGFVDSQGSIDGFPSGNSRKPRQRFATTAGFDDTGPGGYVGSSLGQGSGASLHTGDENDTNAFEFDEADIDNIEDVEAISETFANIDGNREIAIHPSFGTASEIANLAQLLHRVGRPIYGYLVDVVTPSLQRQLMVLNLGCGDTAILGTREVLKEAHATTVRATVSENWYCNIVDEITCKPDFLAQYSASFPMASGLKLEKLYVSTYDDIVRLAVAARASDIHFTSDTVMNQMEIHLRIYGTYRLWRTNKAPLILSAIAASFGQRSKSDTATKEQFSDRNPVAFMTSQEVSGTAYEGRFNGRPHIGGYAGVMRLLESTPRIDKIPTLQQLGYNRSHEELITGPVQRNYGLIIIFGSTGSGKSTTLRTFMTKVTDPSRLKICTAESPAEYVMPGVVQFSLPVDVTQSSAVLSQRFTALLRDLMRMDPDVLMVGEVRDYETGHLISELTQTGHRTYTTAHGDGAVDGVARLCGGEIRMPPDTVAGNKFLSASLYQKLLPVLCSHCKIPATDAEHGLPKAKVDLLKSKFGLDPGTMFVAREGGCPHCQPKIPGLKSDGTVGVTVAVEIMLPTSEMRRAIVGRDWPTLDLLWRGQRRATFAEEDMLGKTAFEHGLWIVSQGKVSLKDLEEQFEPIESYEVRSIKL
jgi:type II secretory ATPase GspE/PulE/Tfp pilus assembly ATPase PilB-like protein